MSSTITTGVAHFNGLKLPVYLIGTSVVGVVEKDVLHLINEYDVDLFLTGAEIGHITRRAKRKHGIARVNNVDYAPIELHGGKFVYSHNYIDFLNCVKL